MKKVCLSLVAFIGLNLCAAEIPAVDVLDCKSAECINDAKAEKILEKSEQKVVEEVKAKE